MEIQDANVESAGRKLTSRAIGAFLPKARKSARGIFHFPLKQAQKGGFTLNYKLREKREVDYSSPVLWSLALLQLGTLAAVLYLCHLVYGFQEVLQEIKPMSNITTEFVIIKACEESFDVAEMKGRN